MAVRLQEIRGLRFETPLKIREGSRKEVARTALENTRSLYGEDLDVADKFLKACGFIPSSMKLSVAVTAYAAVGVKIYYASGEVVLIDPSTPDDLLLNKMALGLLDQHYPEFGVRKPLLGNFDAQMALSALRSGDADIAKNLLWASKTLDEKISDDFLAELARSTETWEKEESKGKSMILPRLFVRSGDFSYRRGAVFVETLRQKGGMDLVNKAYARIPASTEQILHPEKYLAAEAPVSIDLESIETFSGDQGYDLLYRTTLGEFGATVFLEQHLKTTDAGDPTSGWAGDTIEVFEGHGRSMLVWATRWDTEKDAEEFQTELFKVSLRLLPNEKDRTNLVVRRGKSTAWLAYYSTDLQDGLLDALWKCRVDGKEPYGP